MLSHLPVGQPRRLHQVRARHAPQQPLDVPPSLACRRVASNLSCDLYQLRRYTLQRLDQFSPALGGGSLGAALHPDIAPLCGAMPAQRIEQGEQADTACQLGRKGGDGDLFGTSSDQRGPPLCKVNL